MDSRGKNDLMCKLNNDSMALIYSLELVLVGCFSLLVTLS